MSAEVPHPQTPAMKSWSKAEAHALVSAYQPIIKLNERAEQLQNEIKQLRSSTLGASSPGKKDNSVPGQQLPPGRSTKVSGMGRQSIEKAPATRPPGPNSSNGNEGPTITIEADHWRRRCLDLEKDLERHQASYMRREDDLMARVEDLELQLRRKRDSGNGSSEQATHDVLSQLQEEVLTGLDGLLDKQRMQIKAEEATVLRQFRARLNEVEMQVRAEREQWQSDQEDFANKTISLRQELAMTQQIAEKLDQQYKACEIENQRLRVQYKCQEDDRQFLIRRIISLKKDNMKLQEENETLHSELDQLFALGMAQGSQGRASATPLSTPPFSRPLTPTRVATLLSQMDVQEAGSPPASSALPKTDKQIKNYELVIDGLRKLLETERQQHRRWKQTYTQGLQQRTELQSILVQCWEEVRRQEQEALTSSKGQPSRPVRPQSGVPAITRRRPVSAFAGSNSASSSMSGAMGTATTPEMREMFLERVTQKQQLIQLLLHHAFPGFLPNHDLKAPSPSTLLRQGHEASMGSHIIQEGEPAAGPSAHNDIIVEDEDNAEGSCWDKDEVVNITLNGQESVVDAKPLRPGAESTQSHDAFEGHQPSTSTAKQQDNGAANRLCSVGEADHHRSPTKGRPLSAAPALQPNRRVSPRKGSARWGLQGGLAHGGRQGLPGEEVQDEELLVTGCGSSAKNKGATSTEVPSSRKGAWVSSKDQVEQSFLATTSMLSNRKPSRRPSTAR